MQGLEPPSLVGRARELEWLNAQFASALAGQASLVLVNGEAGIGKTALIEELALAARRQDTLILVGGGHDLTTPRPYALWIEVVDCLPLLEDSLPDPPSFLTPAGSAEAAGSQAELFNDAVQFFVALTAQRPVLIVLEDLHWVDRESLDLMRALASQLVGRRALIVGTYRGAELSRDAWLARLLPHLVREARARQMDLGPLGQSDVEALVAGRYELDDDSRRRLVDYLHARAEGNPLYTLELLRGLESGRTIRPTSDGWVVADLEALPLPSFLHHLIDERLADLPADIRDRLAIAAVIGDEIPFGLWADVCDLHEPELLHTLDLAANAGLVEAAPDGQSMRFSHALFRQALYELTLPPRRAALHRRIAKKLAESPNPDPDAVSWHFQSASDVRAASWLIKAAERAQRAYAWSAAAERLIAAERLVAQRSSGSQLGWLRYRIGRLRRLADPVEAMRWLRQAEQIGVWSGDRVLTAYARFDLGHIEVLAGDYDQGLQRMMSADAMLEELGDDVSRVNGQIAGWVADVLPNASPEQAAETTISNIIQRSPRRGTLIQWLVEPGHYREAREQGEAYLKQLDGLQFASPQQASSAGDTWFAMGRIHAAMGEPDAAQGAFVKAVDWYQRIDHHVLVGVTRRALLNEVIIPHWTDRPEQRERMAQLAEDAQNKATGALSSRLPSRLVAVDVLLLDGDWASAREILEIAVQPGAAIASNRHQAMARLGWLAVRQGRDEEALRHTREILPGGPDTEPGTTSFVPAMQAIETSIDITVNQGNDDLAATWLAALDRWLDWSGARRWKARAQLAHGRAKAATGNIEQALDRATAAFNSASTPRQPLVQLSCLRLLGELATISEQFDAASEHLDAALTLARECAAPYEIALTELALAGLHARSGESDVAHLYLERAVQALQRLEATPALDRAKDLQALLAASEASQDPFGLSDREREVLRLVATGMTDAEVAERLSISYRTVTTHLTSIFNKLGVNSRVVATRIAVEHDLL